MVSDSVDPYAVLNFIESLNPCCNGIWSQTMYAHSVMYLKHLKVLILVVMEYGLRLRSETRDCTSTVLILVVMEYGLRHIFTEDHMSNYYMS